VTTLPKGLEPTSAAGRLRGWALLALNKHSKDGTLPTSLRHLFYEAVMAEVIAKGDPSGKPAKGRRPDQNLTDAVTWLREQGFVPWDWVEDRTRHLSDYRGDGDTILGGLDDLLDRITIDPYGETLPILVVESESGAGVLSRTAAQYRVPVIPTRGQSAGWLRTKVAETIGDRSVVVGYLGDADKAGDDIEANSCRVLTEVLDVNDWVRVGLTWDQVRTYRLPTVERYDGRDKITRTVCELEALPQRLLLNAVRAFLDTWLDEPLADVREREDAQRAEIRERLREPL
jgi:hypothetical protein